MREPHPRSSTMLATAKPSAARWALMGCASRMRCISADSSFTTAAVCNACEQWGARAWTPTRGIAC